MINFINSREISRSNRAHKKAIINNISRIIDSGNYINGEYVHRFEKEFAEYCQARYCISVNSGTDGLTLSLKNSGVKHGDEVLVPSLSFIATAFAPLYLGAKVSFVDIDLKTYNIDYQRIAQSSTSRRAAIIPVHWAGRPLEQKKLREVTKRTGMAVIEDAAQAAGAFTEEGPVGSSGNQVIVSFFPTKNLSCLGDGGAILTSRKSDSERLKLLRNFGRVARESFCFVGQNSRLDEIQAMILSEKLKGLDMENNRRRHLAKLYDRYLDKCIIRPKPDLIPGHAYHFYVILLASDRDNIQRELKKRGIDTATHYKVPIHRHLIKMGYSEYKKADLGNTEEYANRCLSLPMYSSLKDEDIFRVAKNINALI